MACTEQIPAWKPPVEGGKLSFSPQPPPWEHLFIPCGKCEGCRADQSLMWAIRCYHESQGWMKNCFLTLTYDDDHLPSDGKIVKEDLQKFFRALRDSGTKLRYFACGEYGDQTRRPHYHAIIFGQDFRYDREDINDDCYTSPTLLKYWRKGHIMCAPVTVASIMYVCGYVSKKIGDPDTFNLMSRRPGIGANWLKKYGDDIRRTGLVTVEGQTFPVPDRYLEWDKEFFADVIKQRQEYAKRKAGVNDTAAAFRSKRINNKAKLSGKKEKL